MLALESLNMVHNLRNRNLRIFPLSQSQRYASSVRPRGLALFISRCEKGKNRGPLQPKSETGRIRSSDLTLSLRVARAEWR